jgi:hypothetical protein
MPLILAAPAAYGRRRHLARLFGVRKVADIHEKLADFGLAVPLGAKARRRLELIDRTGILFIHVPKNAGTSISSALYGRTSGMPRSAFISVTRPGWSPTCRASQ